MKNSLEKVKEIMEDMRTRDIEYTNKGCDENYKALKCFIKEYEKKQEIIDKTIKKIKFEWSKILENESYQNHSWTVDGLIIKWILEILKGENNEN